MYHVIQQDGTGEWTDANEFSTTYRFLNTTVGGYIELLRFPEGIDMWINEDGKYREGFESNAIATTMAWAFGIIPTHDDVRGPVVLAGSNAAGDTIPLTDAQRLWWLTQVAFIGERILK